MADEILRPLPNTVTFPRALRDAIPEHELCAGRALQLDSLDALPLHTAEFGRRVAMRLRAVETGKLTGQFNLLVDLDITAAKTLAQTLLDAVDQAVRLPPVSLWGQKVMKPKP
jgi:hypothetical protein